MSSAHKTVAKALIHDKDGSLLLVRDNEYWDLPGGNVEQGEQLVHALARELNEELGITSPSIDPQPAIAWTMTIDIDQNSLYKIELDFKTSISETPIANKAEIDDLAWFSHKEVVAYSKECAPELRPLWKEFLYMYNAWLSKQ